MSRRNHHRHRPEPRNRFSENQRSRYASEYRAYDDRDDNNMDTGRDYQGRRFYSDEIEGGHGRGEYQGDQYDARPGAYSDREGRSGYGTTRYNDGGDTYENYDGPEDYYDEEDDEEEWDDYDTRYH